MTSTAIYRSLMVEFERQRLARGLSMAAVDDLAGTQDGYYAKMIYPDTPSGRQAQWMTVDLVASALFGRDFGVSMIAGGEMLSAPSIDKGASHNALKNRHWRHGRHFRDLGAKGAAARNANMNQAQRSAAARKAARMLWRKVRAAKRQGEVHAAANEGKSR